MDPLKEGLVIILMVSLLVIPQIIMAQLIVDDIKGKNGKK